MPHRLEGRPRHLGARLGAAGLSIVLTLSACDPGPDYKHPDTETPAAWRESDSSQPAQWPAADWWKGFGSPELDGFIERAERANFDLGAAVARVQDADAQVRIAGAPLLPSVQLNSGATTQLTVSQFSGNQLHFSNYTAAANASYEIDFWGKNRAALSAAKFAALASRYDQEVVRLTVVSSVATTYFLALGLQDRLQVARDNLANAESVLDIIRARQRVGTAMVLDIAQQETVVAGLQAAIPPLEQQLSQAIDALAILLGKPPEDVKIAASLSQPIFEGGLLEGQLQFSKARYQELLQDYIKAIISAFSNVEDSLVSTRRTGEQQADEKIAVQKAQLAYDISQAQFRIGTIDLLTVLTTENTLFTADDLLVQDELAHMQALVGLFDALGGGWRDSDLVGTPGVMSVSDRRGPAGAPSANPVK